MSGAPPWGRTGAHEPLVDSCQPPADRSRVRLLLPEGETGGDSLVTYTHHFLMADGSPAWVISFTNGHVTDKPSL